MMTGLHPHRNGTLGFVLVPEGVPNLSQLLMAKGYYTASFNKGRGYKSFKWTEFLDGYGTRGFGRDPGMFVASAKKAIAKAKSEGKPFFLNVAISDPHRAFPVSLQESEELEAASYPYSTRTPLIVRWPGVVQPGRVDREHMVSTMDLMPTLLEAVTGIPAPVKLDVRSLSTLLKGQPQAGRDHVFTTQNYITPGTQVYPMRAVHTRDYSCIFNAWSDGKTKFNGECHSGLTFDALLTAAKTDAGIAERVKQIEYRVREELYDVKQDPGCLHNLVNDEHYATVKAELKKAMTDEMVRTEDPLLPSFQEKGTIPASWLNAKKKSLAE